MCKVLEYFKVFFLYFTPPEKVLFENHIIFPLADLFRCVPEKNKPISICTKITPEFNFNR